MSMPEGARWEYDHKVVPGSPEVRCVCADLCECADLCVWEVLCVCVRAGGAMKHKNWVHTTLLTVAAPFSFVELSVFVFPTMCVVWRMYLHGVRTRRGADERREASNTKEVTNPCWRAGQAEIMDAFKNPREWL